MASKQNTPDYGGRRRRTTNKNALPSFVKGHGILRVITAKANGGKNNRNSNTTE